MSRVRTVSQLLVPLVALAIGLVLVVGGAGITSVLISTRSVEFLIDDLEPALAANEAILQDLTDAETGARAWGLTGNPATLKSYRLGTARVPGHQNELRRYADAYPETAGLVRQQEKAVERWFTDYGEVRVGRPGGEGSFRPALFDRGTARFDDIRAANARIDQTLTTRAVAAREDAEARLSLTAVLLGGSAALGGLVLLLAGVQIMRRLRSPLRDLETVVERLTAGELGARAVPAGPRETRSIALALNALAEENARAFAMEAQVREQLQSIDTAKGDFVSNVSHELRTPLTVISGYVELFADDYHDRLALPHQKMLESVQRNVTRLRELIEDLLTLSRAENHATDLEQVDLRGLVGEAAADNGIQAKNKGITMEVTFPDDPVLVLADRAQLQRAVLNVVGNAVKFSTRGGTVEVCLVDSRGRYGRAEIVVRDRGIGIPAADLDRLGTRFFRAANAVSGEVAGTGLGLRIVQIILGNHGGDVAVESVEGEGTTVTLRLPALAPAGQ